MAEDIGVIAKIILTIIGVPIFILGLYFLIYTDPAQRDTRVSAFNLAVDEWDNHTSSLFDHVSISVSVGEGTNAVVLGKQTEFFDTQSHNVFGHPDASTSAFTSIRYEHSGVIGVLTSSYPFSSEGWATAMFNVTDTQTGLTSTFSLQLPTTSVKHVAGNRKVCLHQTGYAYWDSSRSECLANNMLTDVCVRLSRTSDGYIQGGASGTGAGCAPARNWYPFSFSHLAQDVTEVGGIADFSGFRVRVYSADDPLIRARAITDGTMDFGPTTGERVVESVMCLIVGLGILFPTIITLALAVKSSRRKKAYRRDLPSYDYDGTDEESAGDFSPIERRYDQDEVLFGIRPSEVELEERRRRDFPDEDM
mmetsp:Transcript_29326/g.75596  ORF Transcript_29326/g.75596 Transcript_29326/m.75596 type:complete len:364 (-) Transcript_29326:459-1550(-)